MEFGLMYLHCMAEIREAARQWLLFGGGKNTPFAVAAARLAYGYTR